MRAGRRGGACLLPFSLHADEQGRTFAKWQFVGPGVILDLHFVLERCNVRRRFRGATRTHHGNNTNSARPAFRIGQDRA